MDRVNGTVHDNAAPCGESLTLGLNVQPDSDPRPCVSYPLRGKMVERATRNPPQRTPVRDVNLAWRGIIGNIFSRPAPLTGCIGGDPMQQHRKEVTFSSQGALSGTDMELVFTSLRLYSREAGLLYFQRWYRHLDSGLIRLPCSPVLIHLFSWHVHAKPYTE